MHLTPSGINRLRLPLCILLLPSLLLSGCRILQATADLPGNAVRAVNPGKPTAKPPDPVVLQQDLTRLADELSTKLDRALIAAGDDPRIATSEADLLGLRLGIRNRLIETVSGPNAFVNLVDMVFMTTLLDDSARHHFVPNDTDDPIAEVIDVLQEAHRQTDDLAVAYLGQEQVDRLNALIEPWLDRNVLPSIALFTRYQGLTQDLLDAQPQVEDKGSNSLFGALMIDPLAGLDPTVRELTQTRLLAERAFYVGQRTPPLLRLQSELLAVRMLEKPAVTRMVEMSESSAASVERITTVAESLPDHISQERAEILTALEEQSAALTTLMTEVKTAISHGEGALVEANQLVPAVDRLLNQLGVYEPADPDAPPFDINDYTTVLRELQVALVESHAMVRTAETLVAEATSDETIAKFDNLTKHAIAQSEALADRLFWRALLLVALTTFIIGGTVLLVRRWSPRREKGTSS